MERVRSISIDPYIDQGGIMGSAIEVNSKAASSIMKRAAVVFDISVHRGFERDVNNVVGSKELAVVKSRSVFSQPETAEDKKPSLSRLIAGKGEWIVRVNDQAVHDRVDSWMEANYKKIQDKSGQEQYRERFVLLFNNELSKRVAIAAFQEKKSRLKSGLYASAINDSLLAASSVSLYFGGSELINGGIITVKEFFDSDPGDLSDFANYMGGVARFLGGFMLLGVGATIANSVYRHRSKTAVEQRGRYKWERFVPNPQISSAVLGSVSILLNKGKIVQLKKRSRSLSGSKTG